MPRTWNDRFVDAYITFVIVAGIAIAFYFGCIVITLLFRALFSKYYL